MCPAFPTSESSSLKVWQLSKTRSASAANSSELVYLGGGRPSCELGRRRSSTRGVGGGADVYSPSSEQPLPHGGEIHRVFDNAPVPTHQTWVHRLQKRPGCIMGLHFHQDNPIIKGTVMAASQEANTLTLPAFSSGKGRANCPQNHPTHSQNVRSL